jgi:PHD/YefM family antitoxin component YafN of YafNO toxin-antitoxin module
MNAQRMPLERIADRHRRQRQRVPIGASAAAIKKSFLPKKDQLDYIRCSMQPRLGSVLMTAAVHVPLIHEADLQQLLRKPVSDVKREGWRGIMRSVDSVGTLLMTNHNQPEAVILSLHEYRLLTEQATRARRHNQDKLERLSRAFDADMALLQQPGSGERLREAFDAPLGLNGEVIAGRSF